ncbi:helix-turn-helix domain-containing protein [Bradyrhizobium ottawaense]|uniref:helix-turn-helix domain-containing protein n=1 Tax=Bradyrhizobium ottawaense TaxID=931866 RepID=UPI0035181FC4
MGRTRHEISRLRKGRDHPAGRAIASLGIPRATFYRWYDRYREGGVEALADHRSRPDRVWYRSPTMCGVRSSTWRWSYLSCRHASWPCGSPTNESTLSPRRRSIGC